MSRTEALRWRTPLLAVCLAMIAGAALAQPPAQPQPSRPKPRTVEELQKAVQEILTKEHVPGAGIALVDKDHIIWAGGVGEADLAAHRRVTAHTQFRAGSISKSFVALALLKLQEEGRIDLNARLRELAPEIAFQNPWEAMHPVRVANLLEHTAGFDDMEPGEIYNRSDPVDIPLLEVFTRFSRPQRSRWPPGTRMAYSNPSYGIAGYVIEKVTGKPFDDYIEEAILKPLGMIRSSFDLTEANRALLAQGYDGKPPKPVPYRNIYLRPAGDLKASPAEMARFVQMLLNRGRLGDVQLARPESIDRMEVPETTLASRAGLKNGYGPGNFASLSGAAKTHGHDGGIGGFISRYAYIRELGLGYVVFLNSSNSGKPLEDISRLVLDYLLAGRTVPQQPAVKLAEAQLQSFVGHYERANPRNQMLAFLDVLLGTRRVSLDNGALYQSQLFQGKQALVPVSPNLFRLEKQPEASLVFCKDDSGRPILIGTGFYGERISAWWSWTRVGLMAIALALLASSLVFALVWVPRKLFKRMKGVGHLWVRGAPLLAGLALLVAVLLMGQLSSADLGTRNWVTVSLYVATWLFPLLSVWALLLALWSFRLPVHPGVRFHSLLVSIACCGLTAYMGYWHLIGFKLWS